MEEAVKQCPVSKKELSKVFVNGKNTVPVGNMNEFKGHRSSTLHGVEIPTGRTETAVAAEGTNFNLPHLGQPYMAPPKERSPQLIILSTFSIIDWRGCNV